jgi:DNA-directed RNA polymerase subunit RPC12/RpoP
MADKHGSGLQCPSCRFRVTAFKSIYSAGFRCPQCGIRLQVSPTYGRALVLISYLIGFFLVWVVGVRSIVRFCLFWTATTLVVLTIVIRVAPHLLRPTLIARQPGHMTTLGLGNGGENRRQER